MGDSLRDSGLFFEFMPAAQDTHCFFTTMSGPNRWSKSTGMTARGSRDRIPTIQEEEEEPYRSEDSEYDQEPPRGLCC